MSVKELRWLFVAAIGTILALSFFGTPVHIGVSAEWINGQYRFAGGTASRSLALAGLVIALYLLLLYSQPASFGQPLPGLFRRFVAFWLDFTFAVTIVAPVIGILATLTEWKRTGVFEWNFERTEPVAGDNLSAIAGVTLMFAALALYYALPLARRKPSPGTCIMGYQIVPEENAKLTFRKALLRTVVGFFAVCAGYLAPFIGRDANKGKFWLDKVFGTRAVKLN
jgi:RDD family